MEDLQTRLSDRERILIELKSIIKQVYHEAVNHELSPNNVTYITQSLLKKLDEGLLFGIKHPSHGYWRIVQKIIHPDTLSQLVNVNGFNQSNHSKGRAWVMLSILDDAFVSYMNCFVLERHLEKYYEDWSILRHNDSCHSFLSVLSGLENVSFTYNLQEALIWPTECKLAFRYTSSSPPPWSPASSLTDSGVQLDRSDDYINGNVPGSPSVVMRRRPKDAQRHVSFHEDSLAKSPSQRKLRWDVENSRYSWAGEELDPFKLPSLGSRRFSMERSAPEGEEAPEQKEVSVVSVVRRSVSLGKRARRLSTRKLRLNTDEIQLFNLELEAEIRNFRKTKSVHEVELPDKLSAMLGIRGEKKVIYKLWGKMIIITTDRLIILHKDLRTTVLTLTQITQVVVYPHGHELHLLTKKQTHALRCGDNNVAHEVLTRIAYNMHRLGLPPIDFRILQPSDMAYVKQDLISRRVLADESVMLYMGLVRLQPSYDRPLTAESLEKSGALMYHPGRGQPWKPVNVVLRGGVLYLYSDGQSTPATINIVKSCGGCERASFPDRPHTFRLSLNQSPNLDTPSANFYQDLVSNHGKWAESTFQRWASGKSTRAGLGHWLAGVLKPETAGNCLYLAAADEYEMSEWLQALLSVLCQGKEDGQRECEASEASLLITEDTIVLFNFPTQAQFKFRVLASALIHDITSFSVGRHPQDAYCIIEFECMEAGSATSDWFLHFGSRAELDQCRTTLEKQWNSSESFPYEEVEDERCKRTQDCLAKEWFA